MVMGGAAVIAMAESYRQAHSPETGELAGLEKRSPWGQPPGDLANSNGSEILTGPTSRLHPLGGLGLRSLVCDQCP
jgi:hypothetical protein